MGSQTVYLLRELLNPVSDFFVNIECHEEPHTICRGYQNRLIRKRERFGPSQRLRRNPKRRITRINMNASDLIYDWNSVLSGNFLPKGPVLLNDETLRDGLQSPSVRDPSIEQKIGILHLMEALGINALDLGLPGAVPRAVEHVEALAREIVGSRMRITANCAARTLESDIRPIAEIVQRTGLKIEAATFIGSSPLRRYTENWTEDFLLQTTEKAVKFAVSLGLDS